MKASMRRYGGYIIAGIVASALTAGGPAVAGSIVDYAKNTDKVDGKHAVASSATVANRANKLVATNSDGRLPNNIVAKAPDAAKLGGKPPTAFATAGHVHTNNVQGAGRVRAGSAEIARPVEGDATTFAVETIHQAAGDYKVEYRCGYYLNAGAVVLTNTGGSVRRALVDTNLADAEVQRLVLEPGDVWQSSQRYARAYWFNIRLFSPSGITTLSLTVDDYPGQPCRVQIQELSTPL